MGEPTATAPPAGHVPGAGIDFTSVGSVRIIDPDQVGSALPRTALPGVRLAASCWTMAVCRGR
jgi:hypothetical protein